MTPEAVSQVNTIIIVSSSDHLKSVYTPAGEVEIFGKTGAFYVRRVGEKYDIPYSAGETLRVKQKDGTWVTYQAEDVDRTEYPPVPYDQFR